MTGRLKRSVLVNLAWLGGTGLVAGLLIGGLAVRLGVRKARVAALQADIEGKQQELTKSTDAAAFRMALDSAQADLTEWNAMADSGSQRIAALSTAAIDAGVTIVGLRNVEEEATEGLVRERSHEIACVGSYQGLARFFDSIYSVPGMAGIAEVEIEHRKQADPSVLQASLLVSWYAPGAGEAAEPEESP